jgi:hypothetical protein
MRSELYAVDAAGARRDLPALADGVPDPQKTIRRLSNCFALVAETHKRFGRGLGKGMCDGTLAAICRVSRVDGPTAGLTGKAAIGSLDADLRTACDL